MRLLPLSIILPALIACSSDSDPATASTSSNLTFTGGTTPFACTTTGVDGWAIPGGPAFDAFRAATGIDYIEAHQLATATAAASIGVKSGVACSSATCAAALAASTSTTTLYTDDAAEYGGGTLLPYPAYWLAYTKGDEARVLGSLADLRALTPVIDGPAKAYLWAEAQGWRVECGQDWYRAAGDAHELFVSRLKVACQPRETAILRIAHDGTVTVLETGAGSAACL